MASIPSPRQPIVNPDFTINSTWLRFFTDFINQTTANIPGTGLIVKTSSSSITRSLSGTNNQITVTNPDGLVGNPTISIASTYIGQPSITTVGTISSGTWNGSTIGSSYLSPTSVIAGSYGSSSQVGVFTVNAQGQLTAASNTTITGISPGGTAGGDLSSTYPNPTVAKINGVALGTTTATSGNLLIGSGTQWVTNSVSGDGTLSSSGSLIITKTNGSNFSASATTDTTNASNISSGTLAVGRGGTGQTTYTDGQLLIGNTTGNTLAKSTLTAGSNITITNGHGTITIAAASSTGFSTVNVQSFTSNGTYTPTASMKYCIAEMIAGGGGGGGVAGDSTGRAGAAGGGAGGYARVLLTAAQIGASQTVTIGAAGIGASAGNNTGGTGGTTSLGALISCAGGVGGSGSGSNTADNPSGGLGGAVTVSTGSTIQATTGWHGENGISGFAKIDAEGGAGANSWFGSGGQGQGTSDTAGNAGSGYGAGGGGAMSFSTNKAGGAGMAGYLVITEYI